ncbi:MAG: hypothetical protein EYC68_04655 [Chloroflexota bacterium]|nr:MAG: hypothetical protein EYC68_04655 [Chloroflexota bacterium]
MRLSEAFQLFITDLIAVGRSPYTLAWYRQYIGRLISFFGDCSLDAVSVDDMRAFLASLRSVKKKYTTEQTLSPATVAGYVRAIRRFYSWLEENEHITPNGNIGRRLKMPRLPKSEPKSISDGDLRKMISVSCNSPRDFAIVLFLADTGCRIGGLEELRLSNLNLEQRQAVVTEKGRVTRTVFFIEEVASALRAWLDVRKSDTDFVFVADDGKRLTRWGFRAIFDRLKLRADVAGRANPHSFRHRFARSYIKQGGDLGTLSDLMGHSDVLVTKQAYAIFQVHELQRKHDDYSPLHDLGANAND